MCRQVCVEHAAYQWRFAQQLCTDTVSGRGMERGLGWGEERRGRERVQQSEREKVRATHQIERDAESRRRGPLDFCQGFPATAEAGIDSFFPLIPGDSPFSLPSLGVRSLGEWLRGAQKSGGKERSREGRRAPAQPQCRGEGYLGGRWKSWSQVWVTNFSDRWTETLNFGKSIAGDSLCGTRVCRKMLLCRSATYLFLLQKTFEGRHERFWHLLKPCSSCHTCIHFLIWEFAWNGPLMTVTVITSPRLPADTSSPLSPACLSHPPRLALSCAGSCGVLLPGSGMNKLKSCFSHRCDEMTSELR